MTKTISQELLDDMRLVRETALQVRDEMSSPSIKARLDRALEDLEEIPSLFDSEEAMRIALALPKARIRSVVEIKDKYGANAEHLRE